MTIILDKLSIIIIYLSSKELGNTYFNLYEFEVKIDKVTKSEQKYQDQNNFVKV